VETRKLPAGPRFITEDPRRRRPISQPSGEGPGPGG
jgi:hypothetical protein